MSDHDLRKLREVAESATGGRLDPGWHWSGNADTQTIALSTWIPGHGRCTVMDFTRWGMQGAQPRFPDKAMMLHPASESVQYEVGLKGLTGAQGRKHPSVYRGDIDGIDHPNARHIATFDPPAVLALLDRLEAAEAKVQRARELTAASSDGSLWQHNGHDDAEGEPECPGCWSASILWALDGEVEPDHPFTPVAGHLDDDECTFREDGTDDTYCGRPEDEHGWSQR